MIVIVLIVPAPVISAAEVETSAASFALYCPDNGEMLLSENADRELPMASTTKIMTTVLTLEAAAQDNRVVEFTDEMTAEGSSMYLKRGEKVTLYDLAVGMMMQSGNDAANAAALALSDSYEHFAALMNEKARQLGMKHTHFVTPNGLDDDDHYSTARDMALLMDYAMRNEDFAYITAQTSMEVHFVYPADKFVTYPNHNKLLRMDKDCIGGKTGYTDQAGRCLVTAARRDGITLIAVTLDDRNDWKDHIALYDEGFARYERITVGNDSVVLDVVGGVQDAVKASAAEASVVIPKGSPELTKRVCLPAFVYAPVEAGERLGTIEYSLQDKVLIELPLTADESVGYLNQKRSIINYIKDLLHWHS